MKSNKKIIVLILSVCLVLIGLSLYQSKYSITVSQYNIESDQIDTPIRIVQITDLHNSVFGKENEKLIEKIQAQQPDIITITGDLLDANSEDCEISRLVVEKLVEIAPVYLSYGNHELMYEEKYGVDIKSLFEDCGAVVLDKDYIDTVVNGESVRIGGIYGYCLPEKYLRTNEADVIECAYLREFQDTDAYTVLLCHMPVCWILNDGLDEWNIDCVLSGHVHGGQIILPFIGGVYGPDFGWFPGKLEGNYSSKDQKKNLILSRGLGSTEKIPRFNNIPEIVVLEIQ